MSGHHHRGTPLIRLLTRLGWSGGPHSWAVSCQDSEGRRARLLIGLSPSGVTITPTVEGPLHLTALQVGRLRGAAREAIGLGVLLSDSDSGSGYAADPARGA